MTHAGWVANVDAGVPLNPGGPVPDPHEWARNQEPPPFNRPDVPIRLPEPGYNSNSWYYGGPPDFPWMGKRPARVPGVRICESYLLAYIRELKRATAEQWLQMDDDIKHLQALNQSLAKQALAAVEPETKPTPTTQKQSQVRGGQWPTTPHRG